VFSEKYMGQGQNMLGWPSARLTIAIANIFLYKKQVVISLCSDPFPHGRCHNFQLQLIQPLSSLGLDQELATPAETLPRKILTRK
jgi:hypothetical protein